ncbi:MAG: glycosyltransferase family 1 protein [Desulfomicrobiaceae bacterium]|nr:glycosyltransferase family 1 protein [Desulfomicrobiaceae bacterium]
MKIAAIDLGLAEALSHLGHEVLPLHPPDGVHRLAPLLGGFTPDLIIQQERLGPRAFLADLSHFSCPKVFWSIDTHLNAFWHTTYGRLFDAVLTTQKSWVEHLQRAHPHVRWLPWPGTPRPYVAWEKRTTPALFVGRVGPSRPVRGWFVELCTRIPGFRLETDLPFEAMLDAYAHACIAPNEAILGEINFRLLEAASCGCAVLTPRVPGVEELFVPGEEVLLYEHGGDFLEMLRDLAASPAKARLFGIRAYARVQAEHLPEHRARQLLDCLPGQSHAAQGAEADAAFWCTIAVLREAERLEIPPERLRRQLLPYAKQPEAAAALLRLEVETAPDAARATVERLALTPPQDPVLCGLAALAALRLKQWEAAAKLHAAAHVPAPHKPTQAVTLLAWATYWEAHGRPCRPGFVFAPKRHLPASALEAIILAHELFPEDPEPPRRLAELLAPWRGYEALRLGALSFLGLRAPDDWRLALDIAGTNARAFRLQEAAEELALAADTARRHGALEEFTRALNAADPSGALARLLPCTKEAAAATESA